MRRTIDTPYRLKLLGGLRLEADKKLSGRVTQRRQLALLAAHDSTRRDKLIGLLWPETGDDRARHLLKRGDPAAAVVAIEGALQFRFIKVRWMLGELYMELERWEDAARVYRSLGFDYRDRIGVWPLSHYKLGIIYEHLDEPAKAIASYEFFVENWKDADPELQPMVEEARQAVSRLEGQVRS